MGQSVVHFEVIGQDPNQLRSFYSELFGWQFSDPIGPTNYMLVESNTNPDGVGIAGGVGGVPEGYDGHVTVYVEVPEVGPAPAQAENLGGKRLMGPEQSEGPVIELPPAVDAPHAAALDQAALRRLETDR